MNTPNKRRVIRASEIGQYAYCAKAWWLGSVEGVAPSNTRELAQGERAHRQHGQRVWLASALRLVALVVLLLALAALTLNLL
jgi:CRISPR/Cas system-associated exonuclease Cas4 (RecB family)